jgi:hypothetical protein
MAEPAPARSRAASSTPITITVGSAPVPLNSNIPSSNTVEFICNQACWIWTWVGVTPTNAFSGETNYYVNCPNAGANGPFSFAVGVNTTITIEATIPGAPAPPPPTQATAKDAATGVKGTIKVTSGQN